MLGTDVYEKVAGGEITLEQLRMLEQVDQYSQLGPDQLLSLIADSASSMKAASAPKRSLSANMGIEKAASPTDGFNGNEDRTLTPEEQERIARAVREHVAADRPRRVGAAVEAGTGAAVGDLLGNHVFGLGWGPIPAMLGAGRNAAGAGIGQFAGSRLGALAGAHTSAPRAGALLGAQLGGMAGAGLGAGAQEYATWQPPAPRRPRTPTATSQAEEPKTAGILGTDWDTDKLKQTAMDATIRGGIGLGLGAAATGAYRAMSGLADKMTSRRDLGRILAVHPQINQGNTPEQVDLAYQSLRRFAPHLTKDPLAGGNALGTILRSTDPFNPSGPPRLSGASVAQELSRLSPQRDPAEEMISGAFQSGASSALRAQDDRAGTMLSHDLARKMETEVRQPFQTQRDLSSQDFQEHMKQDIEHPHDFDIKDLVGVRGQNTHLSTELNRTGREHSILWGALRQGGMSDDEIQDLLRRGP